MNSQVVLLLIVIIGSFINFNEAGKIIQKRGRIVGGHEVTPNSVPFQISIRIGSYLHLCGGAIIDETHVLTAAHCCKGNLPSFLNVIAGDHLILEKSDDEQKIGVKSMKYHEKFQYATNTHDICVLTLKSPLTFNEKVKPVVLPKQGQEFEGIATVTGWGDRQDGKFFSNALMSVDVPLVSSEKYNEAYLPSTRIDESMICSGEGGHDACQGDSGGPMTCNGESRIHCGIVSFGHQCALPDYPGVYAKTAYFRDWIDQTVAANN